MTRDLGAQGRSNEERRARAARLFEENETRLAEARARDAQEESFDLLQHARRFDKLGRSEQEAHIREHGAEPVRNTRASGYSRYQQHITLHEVVR